jgi:hypothetical protein
VSTAPSVELLERSEFEAMEDLVFAATPALAETCGLLSRRLPEAHLLLAARVDILALNRIGAMGVRAPVGDGALDMCLTFARDAGVRRLFAQLVPGARPPDLPARLGQRGFRFYNRWVKLHRRSGPAPAAPTSLRIAQVGAEHATVFGTLVSRAFGWPAPVAAWVSLSVGRPRWRHYMAFDGDDAAATAAMFVAGDVAWLGFGATESTVRGRGAQSALLARRIADATALGCRHLVLETAEPAGEKPAPSFRNVTRLGFVECYRRENWMREW